MGLLDVLNGMQQGPRGARSGGGMSPITMAILALLAYKAVKHRSVISGGLGDLLRQFQQNGQGEVANSWVGPGPNKQISPNDLASALGADQIDALSAQSGLSREELLTGLSRHLPDVIDHLTPDGRLPTESELSGRI